MTEEKERIEPDYSREGFERTGHENFICPTCSAIVRDWWLHRDWHYDLAEEVNERGAIEK